MHRRSTPSGVPGSLIQMTGGAAAAAGRAGYVRNRCRGGGEIVITSSAIVPPPDQTGVNLREMGSVILVSDSHELDFGFLSHLESAAIEELTLALGILVPELDDHSRGELFGLDDQQLGRPTLSLLSLCHPLPSVQRSTTNAS
jgi:hypothetical protein